MEVNVQADADTPAPALDTGADVVESNIPGSEEDSTKDLSVDTQSQGFEGEDIPTTQALKIPDAVGNTESEVKTPNGEDEGGDGDASSATATQVKEVQEEDVVCVRSEDVPVVDDDKVDKEEPTDVVKEVPHVEAEQVKEVDAHGASAHEQTEMEKIENTESVVSQAEETATEEKEKDVTDLKCAHKELADHNKTNKDTVVIRYSMYYWKHE